MFKVPASLSFNLQLKSPAMMDAVSEWLAYWLANEEGK